MIYGVVIPTCGPLLRFAFLTMVMLAAPGIVSAQAGNVYQATLAEPNQKTQEVSTEQVRRILTDGSAIVLDTRKRAEYVAGHIPGALNVDALSAEVVAAVERLVGGEKSKALVLYCNGPFCQASREAFRERITSQPTNSHRARWTKPRCPRTISTRGSCYLDAMLHRRAHWLTR